MDSRSFNLEQGKEMLRGNYRNRVMMQFAFIDDNSVFRESKYISVAKWYKDWKTERRHCPNDNTTVLGIKIDMVGCRFRISGCIAFGNLMEFISKEMKGDEIPRQRTMSMQYS